MSKFPSLVEMMQAGMHFGHQTSRWHPKMRSYIFGSRGGVHILDLEQTQKQLMAALDMMKGIAGRGGVILFVGTKPQAQNHVKTYADSCGMPYVINRWLGGTLTNFGQIKQTLKRMKMLKDQREKGELRKYTKMEQLMISREIEDMDEKFGGIEQLMRTPDALFVLDIRTEKTAVKEAQLMRIPVIALCDSNVNPEGIAQVIPGNDDATKSIELVCKLACEAVKEGKAEGIKTAASSKVTKATEV